MHHLEGLLLALQLRRTLPLSQPPVPALRMLEAITTSKCGESINLEGLELLGDAFLEVSVSEHLFLVYDKMSEGKLSKLRTAHICNATLEKLGRERGIMSWKHHALQAQGQCRRQPQPGVRRIFATHNRRHEKFWTARKYYSAAIELSRGENLRALYGVFVCLIQFSHIIGRVIKMSMDVAVLTSSFGLSSFTLAGLYCTHQDIPLKCKCPLGKVSKLYMVPFTKISVAIKEILYLLCNRQSPRGCVQVLNTGMYQARLLQLDDKQNHEEPAVKRVV